MGRELMHHTKKTKPKRQIVSYEQRGKERVNNLPVGLATAATDPDAGAKKPNANEPHLDPQLIWADKTEHTFFEVHTVSLLVHNCTDSHTIIEAVRKRNVDVQQISFFKLLEQNLPIR
jgi:adenine-specific DNA-methyltransferase